MNPVDLATIGAGGAVLGPLLLLILILVWTLVDLFSIRKEGVPRRAVLKYYHKHLYHLPDWRTVARIAPKVAGAFALVAMVAAIFVVGLIEVFVA